MATDAKSFSGPLVRAGRRADGAVRRLADAADRLGARLDRIPHETAMGAAMLMVFAAMAVLAASPTLFIADHWPDAFLALDAALHWGHGHRPHEDFHTPLGAGYIALMGKAGEFTDFGPRTLIWANAAAAAFIGAALVLVTVRRFNAPLAAVLCLYWTLLALSPRRLAGAAEHVSWAAAYNKWGFALVACLWLATAIPPKRGGRRTAYAETAVLGALLCFLFYMKLTYFAGGLAPFFFKALFVDRGRDRGVTLMPVAAAAGMIVLVAAAGGVSLPGYARDLLMAAKSAGDITLLRIGIDLQVNMLLVGLNLAAYLVHYRVYKGADPHTAQRAARRRTVFLALLILSLGVNSQNTSIVIPLLSLLPLVLATGPAGGESLLRPPVRMAMMFIPAAYCLWWGSMELRAVAHHHIAARTAQGISFCTRTDIAVCRMRVINPDPDIPSLGLTFEEARPIYEELYAALDPLVTPQSRIVHLAFANILDARYGLEPARGGLLFWHYRRNFNEVAKPKAASLFAEATLIVLPRGFTPNSRDDSLARIYGDYVREHFTLAAETKHWRIYRRP